ncbi:MAG TPA: PDZ domain-containing protein, partial [Longimicrobium sp.]|nr:PDZ domain-containing protein [Longimicrobium sp.]
SHRDPSGPPITFREPPLIDGIIPGSAADGLIQAGDVLLAVDGVSIVGRAGGYAFDAIRPHVPVRLTIARNGQRRDVTLVPGLHCHQPDRDDDDDEDDDDDDDDDDDEDDDEDDEDEDPR